MGSRKKNRKLPKFFYRWHRRIGASAAIFFLWIVISGWMLNHSEAFHLRQIELQNSSLAHWYNLETEIPNQVFQLDSHWVTSTQEQWFLDGKSLSIKAPNIIGAAETKNFLALLTQQQLILLDQQGNLIDRIDFQNLPLKNPTQLGVGCGENNDAEVIVLSDSQISFRSLDGLDWSSCNAPSTYIQQRAPSPTEVNQLRAYLTPKISLEKLILDLHTGRFFGNLGVWIVDFLGFCLMLLAASGLWLFLRKQNKHRID